MTAKEIQDHHSFMPEMWLKEIAYQLAVMNEREQAVLDKATPRAVKPYPHTSACEVPGCQCGG